MMLLVAVCLLLASPLSAVELLSQKSVMMTSSGRPHQKVDTPHVDTTDDAGAGAATAALRQRPVDEFEFQKPLGMNDETNDRPPLAELPDVFITDLPAEHSLSSASHGKRKRLVFVGDVHGHLSALQALLHKIGFDHRHGDHLVFVGDIVAKGPNSAGVVKLAMDVGASAVRGNHEDKVLQAHKAMQKKKKKQHHKDVEGASEDPISNVDAGELDTEAETGLLAATRSKHADHARAVARSLSSKQLKWLSSLPVVLRIGPALNATSEDTPWNAGEIVVVHAGLVPSIPIDEQDPWAMMNMRTLVYPLVDTTGTSSPEEENDTTPNETLSSSSDDDSEGPATTAEDLLVAVPSDTRQGEPWSYAWNRHQNIAIPTPEDRTIVIYGHDAKADLQVNIDISIQPRPAERHGHRNKDRKKKKKHHKRAETTDINIEISPETEVDGDGDVEVETEIEIEIEVEDNSGTNGTASGDPSLPSDKLKKRWQEEEADAERRKKHGKEKKKKKGKKGVRYAFGLDSGCGHGRQLSALVLEAGPRPEDGVLHRIEQVDCGEVEE